MQDEPKPLWLILSTTNTKQKNPHCHAGRGIGKEGTVCIGGKEKGELKKGYKHTLTSCNKGGGKEKLKDVCASRAHVVITVVTVRENTNKKEIYKMNLSLSCLVTFCHQPALRCLSTSKKKKKNLFWLGIQKSPFCDIVPWWHDRQCTVGASGHPTMQSPICISRLISERGGDKEERCVHGNKNLKHSFFIF